MPIYSYKCPKCQTEVEQLKDIDDRDRATCPFCKSRLERKITFSGSVWAPTAGGMK